MIKWLPLPAAALLLLAVIIASQPTAKPLQPVTVAADERTRWAIDFAAALGNTQPSADTIAFIVAWTLAEDRGSGAFDRNNPLNTTQTGYGETVVINGDGVKGYPSRELGMAATIETITNGRYNKLLAGLQGNDAELALRGLYASPWGTNADHVASIYRDISQDAPQGISEAPQATIGQNATVSTPIAIRGDDCAENVRIALIANNGALQDVVIQSGEMWSFNRAMGDPEVLPYRYCAGVPGGNWCNLAARYAQVARALGLQPQFNDHGVDLGAGRENAVTIWNANGGPNDQDLVLINQTSNAVRLVVQAVDGGIVVVGRML